MAYFPMMIDLKDKPVLVIGAGEEGTKKVEVLYDFGCKIILVAKEATKAAIEKSTAFFNRPFEDTDIKEEYSMIVSATNDRTLNKHISELAGKNKIPVNVVDDTELCSFIFPAIIKDRDVVVSVSSGGKSPYVAQYIKAIVRDNMPKDIGLINDKMGEYRISAKQEISDVSERRKFLKAKLNDLLEGERK
ncbi:MAG: bifunctional precorrin-2 dehydrogenase/sirohydrochlorin ferrochelatase [Lachnospiraceae bacterium]|nr:bifunctional precorrin-2 dehydrogenase/sirohydrochlorin ferrochelatase [Lachnospiraceae bacterium]